MKETTYAVGTIGLCGESVFLTVPHFHMPGETLRAGSLFTEPGGKAYNQAVAAQRLGGSAFFLGAVGTDPSAEHCRNFLADEGVSPLLQYVEGERTAYACILTDARGENQVTVFRGASERLTPDFIREHESDIARCSCLLLTLECPLEAVWAAAEIALRHRVFTILNPAPAVPLPADRLKQLDLITPNRQEAMTLLGLAGDPSPAKLAKAICAAGIQKAVVTLGSEGALLVENAKACLFPAKKVNAVDTTGAGDTFNAALAVAISRGEPLARAVEYATIASAWSVQKAHVMDSLPTQRDMQNENFMGV
ncbi:ribokinase [Candidatus Allofournierella merdipullorum]|uniref:ribokinase n=1 Tax=Candidatus Allofournierella merdipullorum TaxID=2838595 RepID=UPI002A8BFF5C|nr:ribokinase [Candidatus Fournierella merdipullorum]